MIKTVPQRLGNVYIAGAGKAGAQNRILLGQRPSSRYDYVSSRRLSGHNNNLGRFIVSPLFLSTIGGYRAYLKKANEPAEALWAPAAGFSNAGSGSLDNACTPNSRISLHKLRI